ncbi:hypothetical protein [Pseudomonas sp. Irchel s3h17]|uniref:hypothetical protein n=1 Tax=Pseudomonas sp. Irchel s3h17 TaxID=2009182 RepID=UPI000BA3EFC8|nr:hypothetical protein [Pseudomonas sp. Irchel s3h17]
MSILLPGIDESRVFFEGAVLAPNIYSVGNVRSFAGEEGTDEPDLLMGKDAPTTLAFADNLSDEVAQAAQDSICYAERYATANSNLKESPIDWHAKYAQAMRYCGWTMTSNKYVDHVEKKRNVTMDAIVLDIIKAVAGKNAQAMVGLMGDVYEKIKSDEELVTLFDSNSKKGKTTDFRIVPCLESAKGTAITAFLAMDCELKTEEGGAWFWKWNMSELKMKKVATMVELNMRAHDRVRDYLYEALDMDSADFFKGANLGNKP